MFLSILDLGSRGANLGSLNSEAEADRLRRISACRANKLFGLINEAIDPMWTCPKCGAEVDAEFQICWQCGTTEEGVEDPSFVPEIDAALQPPPEPRKRTLITSLYPISKVCPACGEARHKKIKPDAWIAFVADRLCESCGCRYTPPTPVWASLCFLVIGLMGFLGSLSSMLIVLMQFNVLAFLRSRVRIT
jgi:hypothetical protein